MSNAKLLAITVERFKSFEQKTRVELAPLTIIVGRNNSGKSTLIQSLLLLKQTLRDVNPEVMLSLDGTVDAFNLRELTFGWPAPDDPRPGMEEEPERTRGPTITVEWECEVDVRSAIAQLRGADLANLASQDAQKLAAPSGSSALQQGVDIASSATDGNPESLSTLVFRSGTYRYRVTGYQNVATNFTINSTLSNGPAAPAAQTIPGDFVDAGGRQVDFDGSFTLQWTPRGGEQGFEIEQSTAANPDWQVLADVGVGTTSFALSNQPNGQYFFRVRGLHPGQIGKYVTNPGNAVSVLVDQRSKVDITSLVSRAISNVSLTNGVFQLDLSLTNNSAQTYVPLVDLNVVGITSTSGTVRAINSDNGRNGTSPANAALFSYSQKLGTDEQFTPNEATDTRTLRFQDNASELFNFDAVVTAYVSTGGSPSASAPSSGAAMPPAASGTDPSVLLNKITAVLRFTANPLTKTVTVQLISLK